MNEWAGWTTCAVTCGGDGSDTRMRARGKATIEANGGTCTEDPEETETCGDDPCPSKLADTVPPAYKVHMLSKKKVTIFMR